MPTQEQQTRSQSQQAETILKVEDVTVSYADMTAFFNAEEGESGSRFG